MSIAVRTKETSDDELTFGELGSHDIHEGDAAAFRVIKSRFVEDLLSSFLDNLLKVGLEVRTKPALATPDHVDFKLGIVRNDGLLEQFSEGFLGLVTGHVGRESKTEFSLGVGPEHVSTVLNTGDAVHADSSQLGSPGSVQVALERIQRSWLSAINQRELPEDVLAHHANDLVGLLVVSGGHV